VGESPTFADFVAGWELDIYRAPIYCAIVAGAALGYLGVFVVLRRLVFFTAAVSQASGLGVALSFYAAIHLGLEIHPVLGAAALALLTTFLLSLPAEKIRLSREAVLGTVYAGAWALAVLAGDRISQEAHDIASILFGTAVLVDDADLVLVCAAAAATALVHVLAYRGFVLAAFDPDGARVQGLPVRALDFVSWVLVAMMVALATRALGVLPVFAFSVLPGLAALCLFQRLRYVLAFAIAIGASSGAAGYLAAFFFELPVGASQAAVALAFFLFALVTKLAATSVRRLLPAS
jgi:zinc transport system permease protein